MTPFTDLEKDKLQRFVDDEVLFEAFRKALIETIPPFQFDKTMSNAFVGESIRGEQTAIVYVMNGLREVQRNYRSKGEPSGDKLNPAV